jgi:DNA-binding HxlR family transcriptional regulator
MEKKAENIACPVTTAMTLVGGRWKSVIVYHLSDHTRRFGDIAARIPSISRKVLSEQLKEMEADGLINRQQFKEIPPRVEYSLTELGKSVRPLLKDMATWATEPGVQSISSIDLTP